MDPIEILEENFVFKVKGKLLEIAQATVPQEIAHEARLKKIEKDGMDLEKLYEAHIEYLVKLGGDENVIRSLSRNGLMQIIQTISGAVKKN